MALIAYHYKGKTVGVLGMGRTGLAAAKALSLGGAHVLCWDDGQKGRDAAVQAGFTVADLSDGQTLNTLEALITSPGIPHLYPALNKVIAAAMKANVPVDNDIGLFFKELSAFKAAHNGKAPRIVAITGSNGKSTTTALVHHCLKTAGVDAYLGGNIGEAVFNLPAFAPEQVLVLELSSYQTELARQLDIDVGIFTNLSPDHLDRHNGMGGYFAAKARLFSLGKPSTSVIGLDEVEGHFLANQMLGVSKVVGISAKHHPSTAHYVFAGAGQIVGDDQQQALSLSEALGLKGAHNWQNAAASFAALRALGLSVAQIMSGFNSFGGLPHRMQRIATRDDVVFINDSKATNADAAEKALSTFENIHWIAGGVPKEGGIAPLVPLFDRVKHAYLIGQAATDFAQTCAQNGVAYSLCETLQAAVNEAAEAAIAGDTVLLAPACASFDQFSSFEQRGEQFVKAVGLLLGATLTV